MKPLFVCYIPGLDARRIDQETTPYLSGLRERHQVAGIRTLPSTELVPTLLTGTWPHQNRVWQVSLRAEFRDRRSRSALDWIPDLVVTTAQCVHHFIDRTYDLAAIPARRLRRFDQHRFKYTRRAQSDDELASFADYPTVFGLLGAQAKYLFVKDFEALPDLARRLPTGQRQLEFLEMYALDLLQHWHLDNARAMADALARTDAFIRDLHVSCRRRGVRLMLLVDHGQERVVGTIPLVQALRRSGIPESEFSYFVELAAARLWFHTDRARRTLTDALRALPHTTLRTWQEMHEYHVCFDDDSFGELYAFADAGRVFFPHDFYQPIGNTFLGLVDWHQRQRILNPVHRGNHGYLPHHPSERGWLLVDDDDLHFRNPDVELIDVAPTMLSLVGVLQPEYMQGTSLIVADAIR